MNGKIPFENKFRKEIEEGKFGVVDSSGNKVEIVYWEANGDCPLVAIIDGEVKRYNKDGCSLSWEGDEWYKSLFLVIP